MNSQAVSQYLKDAIRPLVAAFPGEYTTLLAECFVYPGNRSGGGQTRFRSYAAPVGHSPVFDTAEKAVAHFALGAEPAAITQPTPAHYDFPVTPWGLQEHMQTSGDAFVDARRADVIEYAFRIKTDLLGDLKKARHCLEAAISHLEGKGGAK